MKTKKPQGLEITTFKLKGHSIEAFIAANAEIDQFLQRQPGFRSRHIAEQDNGTVIDMLLWDSVEDGTKAMHRLLNETADSPVHNMIDHRTVSWSCIPVLHQL